MSWWVMITTKGRLLRDFAVSYGDGEIHISYARLEEDEEIAVLLDQYHGKARIYRPFDECQRLASLHQYELFVPSPHKTLVERILSVLE